MTRQGQATRPLVLASARRCLLADGYAGLSTRNVAAGAGVPLSQVHYHFGSKNGLVLSLLHAENERRLERQTQMYGLERPLWERYNQACDFLEDDLDTGYVRLFQELVAAGWSNPELGQAARQMLEGWFQLLAEVAHEAADRLGGLGPFTPDEVATLIGAAFGGGESLLLLGFESSAVPVRKALRRVGEAIRQLEERSGEVAQDEGP